MKPVSLAAAVLRAIRSSNSSCFSCFVFFVDSFFRKLQSLRVYNGSSPRNTRKNTKQEKGPPKHTNITFACPNFC